MSTKPSTVVTFTERYKAWLNTVKRIASLGLDHHRTHRLLRCTHGLLLLWCSKAAPPTTQAPATHATHDDTQQHQEQHDPQPHHRVLGVRLQGVRLRVHLSVAIARPAGACLDRAQHRRKLVFLSQNSYGRGFCGLDLLSFLSVCTPAIPICCLFGAFVSRALPFAHPYPDLQSFYGFVSRIFRP